MNTNDKIYSAYVRIMKRELLPAMGCTEPIAIAYCAAKARELLGALPQKIEVKTSGNIIKNAKSVIVPNSGGRRGIKVAAALGAFAGNAGKELEAIAEVDDGQIEKFGEYLKNVEIVSSQSESNLLLDITVTLYANGHISSARIAEEHNKIVRLEKDGKVLFNENCTSEYGPTDDYKFLKVADIYDFCTTFKVSDLSETLERQIKFNSEISAHGLNNDYGANIGKVLLNCCGRDIRTRAKAKAAAGSDARMNGCPMPVVINSGSGNQGMTVSLPVIEYAEELGVPHEKLLRALALGNLLAIYLKCGIGCLSAYCGAVSAGAAAGAAIAYLYGCDMCGVSHTLVNALAITSGIVCDGAKASCAAKISTAVEAGIFGYDMYANGQSFHGGEGVVCSDVEDTIRNIITLGRRGMRETDEEILHIMTCFD